MIPGLPIVGILPAIRRDRVGFQIEMPRRYGPLAKLHLPWGRRRTVVLVTSPELVAELLVEREDALIKAPGLSVFGKPLFGNGLLTAERDFHKRQRRMMAPMFVQKRIAAFAEEMARRAEMATARFRDGETLDFAEETMRVTLEIVGKTLFDAELAGDAAAVADALSECLHYIIESVQTLLPLPPSVPTPRNLRYRRAIAQLDEIVFRMIRERRASGRDHGDLLSMLLAAQDEEGSGGMDDQQVRDELMTIFLAGHETTANALAWTFYELSLNPHVRVRLEEEMDRVLGAGSSARAPKLADLPQMPYALAVLKEAMRMHPPAYMIGREATRDVALGGHTFGKHTIFLVNIIGIHHSPKLYPDPERFEPTRFLGEAEKKLPRHAFMPFGAGSRICIGNHFALMEGHLLLTAFASKVRLDLAPGVRVKPEPLVTLRPKGGMPMRVRVR